MKKDFELNENQIKLIKQALQYVYDSKLDLIKKNRKILSQNSVDEIIKQANEYFDLQDVFNPAK